MESFSGHVSNCAHRLEANYWCSSCDEVEHLGVEEFGDGSFAIMSESYKGSTMKRAGDFFKRLHCPDVKKFRKNSRRRDATELEYLPEFPYGRIKIQNTEQPPGSSMAMQTSPYLESSKAMLTTPSPESSTAKQTSPYPESPDKVGCPELAESYLRELSGQSSIASKSESPTKQEVEDSNSKHVSASSPSTGRERAKTSSGSSVNSQRKSRSELRLSTPGRPFENGAAVWNYEQTGVSNTRMSKSITAHSSQPGSSLVESSGKAPLQSNSRSLIAAGPDQSDDGVVSPLSPTFLRSGGQPKQGLASTMTPLAPFGRDNVQELPSDSPYLSRQDSQKGIWQHGNKNASEQLRTVVSRSPLSTSQVTTNTAIEGSLYLPQHKASLI